MEAALEVGTSGQFDVLVDGERVVGKTQAGFPTEEEIVSAVRAAQKD